MTKPPSDAGRRCSNVPTCALFPKFGLTGSLKVWQTFYCLGNYEACARYQSSLAGRPPPPNMLPNGRELDLDLLGG